MGYPCPRFAITWKENATVASSLDQGMSGLTVGLHTSETDLLKDKR
jgi:hypothetical protein